MWCIFPRASCWGLRLNFNISKFVYSQDSFLCLGSGLFYFGTLLYTFSKFIMSCICSVFLRTVFSLFAHVFLRWFLTYFLHSSVCLMKYRNKLTYYIYCEVFQFYIFFWKVCYHLVLNCRYFRASRVFALCLPLFINLVFLHLAFFQYLFTIHIRRSSWHPR